MGDDYCQDDVLVSALRAGDERAFTWLLDRYDRSLHRVARTFVATDASVDEVVQDTWLGVIEGIDGFEQRSSLKTWIFRIMMNKARTRGVRDKRSVPFSAIVDEDQGPTFAPERFFPADHVDPGDYTQLPGHWSVPPRAWEQPEASLESDETLDQVGAAIAGLPDRYRQVITLRDVEGLSASDVCTVLGLSAANERVLLHRARGRVRAHLERYFTEVNT